MVTSTPPLPTVRVMVVDDHDLVRQAVKDELAKDPSISVIGEAASTIEAIRLVEMLKPDVLLLDIRLPDGTGLEVATAAKSQSPGTKTLVLSAYDDYQYVARVAKLGAAGYLTKSVSGHELVRAIHSVANGWMLFAPGAAPRMKSLMEQRELSPAKGPRGEGILTDREQQILRHLATGSRNSDIANAMHITVKTVEAHVKTVFLKLGVRNRTEAVVTAMNSGWIQRVEYGDSPLAGTLAKEF